MFSDGKSNPLGILYLRVFSKMLMNGIEQNIALALIFGLYLVSLSIGLFFYLKPPAKINGLYGYRTGKSQKNQANWDFANKIAAKYMLVSPNIALVVAMLVFYFLKDHLSIVALVLLINFIYCFSLIVIIPLVERKLDLFDKLNKANPA
jgi:uncharacterized membrane protein